MATKKAPKYLDRMTLPYFKARIANLTEDSQPAWGELNATRMLSHLVRSLEISLCEVPVQDGSNILTRTILKWLAFQVFPFPKNIKSPDYFFPATNGSFEQEREWLYQALLRFVAAHDENPYRIGISEFFGPMPLSYWSLAHAKHFDHHLRQFGV